MGKFIIGIWRNYLKYLSITIGIIVLILTSLVILILIAMAGARWPVDPGECPNADAHWVESTIIQWLKERSDTTTDIVFISESLSHDDRHRDWSIMYRWKDNSLWQASVDCAGAVQLSEITEPNRSQISIPLKAMSLQ
jgi:hypothetical protein